MIKVQDLIVGAYYRIITKPEFEAGGIPQGFNGTMLSFCGKVVQLNNVGEILGTTVTGCYSVDINHKGTKLTTQNTGYWNNYMLAPLELEVGDEVRPTDLSGTGIGERFWSELTSKNYVITSRSGSGMYYINDDKGFIYRSDNLILIKKVKKSTEMKKEVKITNFEKYKDRFTLAQKEFLKSHMDFFTMTMSEEDLIKFRTLLCGDGQRIFDEEFAGLADSNAIKHHDSSYSDELIAFNQKHFGNGSFLTVAHGVLYASGHEADAGKAFFLPKGYKLEVYTAGDYEVFKVVKK